MAGSDWRKELGLERNSSPRTPRETERKGKRFVNQGYWRDVRKWVYALALAIPLAVIYELLTWLVNWGSFVQVRSAVEVGILDLLSFFGYPRWFPLSVIFVLIFLLLFWWQRRRGLKFNWRYLLASFGESLVWGLILGVVLIIITSFLLTGSAQTQVKITIWHQLATSFGAGLYEELVFRVALIPLSAWLILFISKKFGKDKLHRWVALFIAVIFSSLVFSLVHHLGTVAEPFTLPAFLFRFLAGMVFAGVYALRGFGIAAWSHALYNVLVISGIFSALLG